MLFDPFGTADEDAGRFGPDPVDPDSGMMLAALKAAQVFAMLNTPTGDFAVEKLPYEDRQQLLVATGNCLKAIHDVVKVLCLGGPSADRVQLEYGPILFDLINAIDGLQSVETAERGLQRFLAGLQDAD